MTDVPAQKKPKFWTPYLWLLFFLWMALGQLIAYCVLKGYIPQFILEFVDAVGEHIPSVVGLDDPRPRKQFAFGLTNAQRIVTLTILMMPVLFLSTLWANVEHSIINVIKKRINKQF